MTLEQYIANINQAYKRGTATEHTYRGDLKQLLETIVQDIIATNEPKRISCGAPDYVLTRKDIPFGFIEAKDVGDKDLSGSKKTGNKEQFDRYKSSLDNLIFTDYIDFHFYLYDVFITKIAIATITFPSSGGVSEGRGGEIVAIPENFATFTNLIKNFCLHVGQTIKSSKKLAEMMASKARLLADIIELALTNDENKSEDSTLKDQMNAFKEILIHDISPKGFADVYAQTIAYGMFCARLHDPTLPTFSRQEAAELIPKSNPFLRKLFGYIAGPDIDDRIKWVVDGLVDIFLACNVEAILKTYSPHRTSPKGGGQGENPIIHFYETFLSEYDPKLRKARGVWYTPNPVVGFQVRAIDDILKTEFGLPQGIADNSKIKIKVTLQGKPVEQEVHRVQLLDPATGTGTYIAEVIKHIHKKFQGQQGIWSEYVENHLLPRLIGFELLMASYAMAHLQIDLLLTETGFKPTKNQRLKIYLTNSLEESNPDTGTLFANWLSSEANEANFIKRDSPVMIVMGNPPYSGESANKGDWIMKLMEDYKKEPGGKEKLKEQNSKFINDDYVKFLRYGQHFIEKNGSGILAFINPHGFLDNPTFRGMRWNLLKTYDKIYTIDLHGNAKKKEVSPDGSVDVNVFDIEQGVSINIFVKTGNKKPTDLGKVFHYDLYGKREFKYDFLSDNSLKTIEFNSFEPFKNDFLFKKINQSLFIDYNKGINPTELFKVNVMGFQTHRDDFCINLNKSEIIKRAEILRNKNISNEEIYQKYLIKDNRDWKLSKARLDIQNDINWDKKIINCGYRPFDDRPCYFSNVMMDYPRKELIINVLGKENILLGIGRQGLAIGDVDWCLTTVSKNPVDANMFRRGGVNLFPLYLYPETSGQLSTEMPPHPSGTNQPPHPSGTPPKEGNGNGNRKPNLKPEIVAEIAKRLGLEFVSEKETFVKVQNFDKGGQAKGGQEEQMKTTFAPIEILDYIYAVLHSPTYRETYKEFLKIDFPKIPYPKDLTTFKKLSNLGSQIRQIHLLESEVVENYITQYPIGGDNLVTKVIARYEAISNDDETALLHASQRPAVTGRVYINETQYFDNVPEIAWNFYIGGYQPAQKWLKDRKGNTLNFEDIFHYQKIIVALTETDRIMKEIDEIEI